MRDYKKHVENYQNPFPNKCNRRMYIVIQRGGNAEELSNRIIAKVCATLQEEF